MSQTLFTTSCYRSLRQKHFKCPQRFPLPRDRSNLITSKLWQIDYSARDDEDLTISLFFFLPERERWYRNRSGNRNRIRSRSKRKNRSLIRNSNRLNTVGTYERGSQLGSHEAKNALSQLWWLMTPHLNHTRESLKQKICNHLTLWPFINCRSWNNRPKTNKEVQLLCDEGNPWP